MSSRRRDVVTLAMREAVLERDGWRCMAPRLDPTAGECRDNFGGAMERAGSYHVAALELHHVKDQPRMGKRAESDPDHLVTLCPWHHKYSGWGTSKHGLGIVRDYLRRKAQAISDPAVGSGTDAPDEMQLALPSGVSASVTGSARPRASGSSSAHRKGLVEPRHIQPDETVKWRPDNATFRAGS